jgi:hypothetical protein
MYRYTRWKNAHPRDYKIDDAAMLAFVALLVSSPFLLVAVWAYAMLEAGTLLRRKCYLQAAAYLLLTPVFTLAECPGYFKARWLRITG